jgi:hypothetical protein
MRSRQQYIITKSEVHGYANFWLEKSLRLEYEGTKCTASTLLQVLLIAASRTVSIFAACRDLADSPCDQTIRNALDAALPGITELERRLNRSLATELPKALFRKSRKIAIDLTLIPYHGQPYQDEKEIYRSQPKSGTSHFHAYATAAVVHKGHRYTLALTRVEYGEKMQAVVQRLLAIVRRRQVKIRFLLLDKGFFSVEVISYLKRTKVGFIIPAMVRGRKPKGHKKATGLRAIRKKKNGYYKHTLTGKVGEQQRNTRVTICVASKYYTDKKEGKRRRKKLLYVIWKVRVTPREIRETYRVLSASLHEPREGWVVRSGGQRNSRMEDLRWESDRKTHQTQNWSVHDDVSTAGGRPMKVAREFPNHCGTRLSKWPPRAA